MLTSGPIGAKRTSIAMQAAVFSFTLALTTLPTAQDTQLAQRLFDEAVQQMEENNFEAACPKLAESLRIEPKPGTLYTLVNCEKLRGRFASALVRCDEYRSMYEQLTADAKMKQGTRPQELLVERERLIAASARLTLTLAANAPKNVQILRNAEPINNASLGQEVLVDPGDHVLTTQVPGGMARFVRIHLDRGEKKAIQLEIEPAPIPANDGAPAWRRSAAAASFGVGSALLVVGGVTSGLLLRSASVAKGNCRNDGVCTNIGVEAAHDVQSKTPLVMGSLIGSAVGLGMGTIFLLSAPKSNAPKRGRLTPQWNISIAPASPTSAMFGLHATW